MMEGDINITQRCVQLIYFCIALSCSCTIIFLPSSMDPNFCLIVGRSNMTWGKSCFTTALVQVHMFSNKLLHMRTFHSLTLVPSPLQLFSHQLPSGELSNGFCFVFLNIQILHQQGSQELSADQATKILLKSDHQWYAFSYSKLLLLFGFLLFFKGYGWRAFGLIQLCWHWSDVTGWRPHLTMMHLIRVHKELKSSFSLGLAILVTGCFSDRWNIWHRMTFLWMKTWTSYGCYRNF